MKATLLVLASILAVTYGQDMSQLPACGMTCALKGFQAASCSIGDAKCACDSDAFLGQVQQCISTSCDAADQAATMAFAKQYCGAVGVNIPDSASSSDADSSTSSSSDDSATSAPSASMTGTQCIGTPTSAASQPTGTYQPAQVVTAAAVPGAAVPGAWGAGALAAVLAAVL